MFSVVDFDGELGWCVSQEDLLISVLFLEENDIEFHQLLDCNWDEETELDLFWEETDLDQICMSDNIFVITTEEFMTGELSNDQYD